MKNLFDLSGKVSIVTGGTKGIGRAIVETFAQQGARIVLTSRRQDECEAVAEQLNATYGNGHTIAVGAACDINQPTALEALVQRTVALWGRVDIAVSNAAVMPFHGESAHTPEALFKQLMETNIYSNFRFCHALAPHMKRQGGGSIVLVTSAAAAVASPQLIAYCVSKCGETHMAKALAVEFAPFNIRVNCVAPGLTRSEASRPIWSNPAALKAATDPIIPLRRMGEAEEVAAAVLLLGSDAGAFTTGATIPVDGGAATIGSSSVSQGHLVSVFEQDLPKAAHAA